MFAIVACKWSYKRECQEKKPLLFPLSGECCLACIQPDLDCSGAVGHGHLERDWATASCWLYLVGFMYPMVVRRPRLVKLRKQEVLAPDNMPTMILCEARGL